MAESRTTSPFIRRIRVTLGPLEEYKGAASGDVKAFESDGTPQTLRVVCNISKTIMGMPNPSTISIYNLSRGTRGSIQRSLTKITVEAGWRNTELVKIFQGSVVSVVNERNGADIISKISAIPGYGALTRATTSVTYAEGVPLLTAVKDMASNLEGVSVSAESLKAIDGAFDKGGWSFAGAVKDGLTANEYGFSWTVDDGTFQAVGDESNFDGITVLNGQNGGLIMVSPILQGPMQIRTGVKMKAIFTPGVKAGSTVRVQSSIDEDLNGDYRVHTVNYSLDTHTDNWTMDIDSLRYGGGAI